MELDPVFLARLQFAFTIIFHIIFPAFTIGLSAYIATLCVTVDAHGQRALSRLARFWTKIFAVSFAHGRGVGHRPVLPVRHQLEPVLGRRRQRHRAAARLRGAGRVLSRGDVPRRYAVRLEPRAAMAAFALGHRSSRSARRSRHSGSCRPTAGCRRRPATRCATASPIRSTGSAIIFNPSFPVSVRPYGDRGVSDDRLRRARGRRALSAGAARITSEGAHHAAHGGRHARDPGAAAALHRRPARPQHARSTSRSRSPRSRRTGTATARRPRAVRVAGRASRSRTASRSRSRTALR